MVLCRIRMCNKTNMVFFSNLVYKLRRTRVSNYVISMGKIMHLVKHLRHRRYDPRIIEKTKDLVLSPSTAIYRLFLKHCTLNNKTVGITWLTLSHTSAEVTLSALCPLWLLVGIPTAIGHWRSTVCSNGCHLIFFI